MAPVLSQLRGSPPEGSEYVTRQWRLVAPRIRNTIKWRCNNTRNQTNVKGKSELGKWDRAVVMVPDGDRGVVKGGDATKERPEP